MMIRWTVVAIMVDAGRTLARTLPVGFGLGACMTSKSLAMSSDVAFAGYWGLGFRVYPFVNSTIGPVSAQPGYSPHLVVSRSI